MRDPTAIGQWMGRRHFELSLSTTQRPSGRRKSCICRRPVPGATRGFPSIAPAASAKFETTDRGWVAYFNDLHKGRNTGIAWTIFIDVVAVAVLFFSLTGLVLLWIQARQRTSTWPLVRRRHRLVAAPHDFLRIELFGAPNDSIDPHRLDCAVAVVARPRLRSADLGLSVEIPQLPVAEYHRPYVAIWIEGADQNIAANLAVWYQVRGDHTKWLPDLRQWWRRGGRDLKVPVDGVTGATRPVGQHLLKFDAAQAPLAELKPGQYARGRRGGARSRRPRSGAHSVRVADQGREA